MDIKKQIQFWLNSAEHDLPAAENLLKNGHYSWSLFIGHLIIEKALKAIYVQNVEKIPPRTHNLILLSEAAGLKPNAEQINILDKINDFNIEARYPDEKLAFYKLCTKEFAEENLLKIKGTYEWIIQKIT